ncbi:hypothetical protein GCM10010466_34220 [Planomonospora alba]|uniref:ABC transporter domain-containing protein n=1 Tax=Planomonospora alba TaxID=161354 RepID=A0ABP6NB77_9ACTN
MAVLGSAGGSGGGPPLFEDLDPDIPDGAKTGLVGQSGGGKSTLTRLLLRLMDVGGGRILIGGQDIARLRQSDPRSLIAYVPQEPAMFHRSVRDAPIPLLDEATSALDSESGILVQEALWRLMQGRTAVVVAHRLSTVVRMDRLVVLNRGRVVEQGTHGELLQSPGVTGERGCGRSAIVRLRCWACGG